MLTGMDGSEKSRLRRHYRQRRSQSLADAAAGIAANARRELPKHVPAGKRLGLYWPLAHEPDLRSLAEEGSWQLALPAVRREVGLIYLPWEPGESLAADSCGVPAPLHGAPLAPEKLALLLVPALAVNAAGLRLGSGGGWYDRLRADPRWQAVPALAVLPAACLATSLPRDPWDVPFSGWLDEHGVHWIQAPSDNVATFDEDAVDA